MWWQQSLWKLPPAYTDNPDGSGGLRYWMGEMAKWASTGLQRHFVKDIVLPHFYFFAPQVYFSEAATTNGAAIRCEGGILGALLQLSNLSLFVVRE
jgi:hypothetical protein